ncbi:PREDICTED: uncharacterized protein LOC107066889 [Polistes dominula]|uniref:Uncharacterized protein LOC107066889 n=1 Tax=Polistes dominula TaxID=743375 RepID=A0ABM1IB16_POLDO|nr:PREDICTED: uncharacterized protein LOC107066889 [Polistes dominula]
MADEEMYFAKFKSDERSRRLERSMKLSMLKRSVDSIHSEQFNNNTNSQNWSFSMFSKLLRIEDKCTPFNNNQQKIITENNKQSIITPENNKQSIITPENNKQIITEKKRKYKSYVSKTVSSNDKKSPEQHDSFNNNTNKVTTTKMNKYISYEPISAVPSIKESPQRNNCFDKNDATPLNATYKYLGQSERNSINNPAEKSFIRFYNWKIQLNQDCKLVIKGQLESGEITCSKPILKRLTARSIQSICLIVYHLEGNIVDNENELPKYVRCKFYNGFPDDWKNVHSLWQLFILNNHQSSFCWPTDSDDDLNSKVMICEEKKNEDKSPKSSNKMCISETDHSKKIKIDNTFTLETSVPSLTNIQLPKLTTKVHNGNISNKENRQEEHNSVANITQCLNIRNQLALTDIIKEDKVNIIANNLIHKNCPKEYIVKIIQMFNCLEDVFTYKIESNDVSKEPTTDDDSAFYSNYLHSKIILRRPYVSEYQEISPIKKSVDHDNNKIINGIMNPIPNKILQEQSRNSFQRTNIKEDKEDFESEVYGTPKIVFEKVLKNKKASLERDKEKKIQLIMHSTPKDYIKSSKNMKINDRSARHSNFNDIHIEDDTKFSVLDDRIKKINRAIKCNALEQQKNIKQSKAISGSQELVTYEKNHGKVYDDRDINIIEDETSQVDNMNRIRTHHKRKKSNIDDKYDKNISNTNVQYKITKHSTKKQRIINTFNGRDRYSCI